MLKTGLRALGGVLERRPEVVHLIPELEVDHVRERAVGIHNLGQGQREAHSLVQGFAVGAVPEQWVGDNSEDEPAVVAVLAGVGFAEEERCSDYGDHPLSSLMVSSPCYHLGIAAAQCSVVGQGDKLGEGD